METNDFLGWNKTVWMIRAYMLPKQTNSFEFKTSYVPVTSCWTPSESQKNPNGPLQDWLWQASVKVSPWFYKQDTKWPPWNTDEGCWTIITPGLCLTLTKNNLGEPKTQLQSRPVGPVGPTHLSCIPWSVRTEAWESENNTDKYRKHMHQFSDIYIYLYIYRQHTCTLQPM